MRITLYRTYNVEFEPISGWSEEGVAEALRTGREFYDEDDVDNGRPIRLRSEAETIIAHKTFESASYIDGQKPKEES